MRGLIVLPVLPLFLMGCPPPANTQAPRAVVEIYMHANGLSNCVDEIDGKWKADPSCCPAGFELAGFSAPAATTYQHAENGKEVRRIYRHVVCVETKPVVAAPK